MRNLLKLLKPLRLKFILCLFFDALIVFFITRVPKLYAGLIDQGVIKGDSKIILQYSFEIFLYIILSTTTALLSIFTINKVMSEIQKILQKSLAQKILHMGRIEVNNFGVPKLLTSSIQDIKRIQKLALDCLTVVPQAILTAIMSTVEGVTVAPELSWILIVLSLVTAVVMPIIIIIVTPKFKIYRKLCDKLAGLTRQNITGAKVVRAFSNESLERRKFIKNDKKMIKNSIFIDNVFSFEDPIFSLIFNLGNLSCIWFGLSLLKTDIAYIGAISAFIDYTVRISFAFINIANPVSFIPRAKISIDRINKILNTKQKIKWEKETIGTPSVKSKIEFKNVSFAFADAEENLLEGISFTINEGETVAFLGSTGSGKTTLVELILRFHDLSNGEILIDEVPLKNYSKKDLMSKIGYVPQKGVIFSGTVNENIMLGGNNPTQAEIRQAAKNAMASEFIEKLPKKYDSIISQTGRNLSGGQKQRISIARAIVKKPEILIFDDAFSALDMKIDKELRKNLAIFLKDSIKIIVAQRISTIREADKIIVLDKGKIVGIGNHCELLEKSKTYLNIAKSQLSDQEIMADLERGKHV